MIRTDVDTHLTPELEAERVKGIALGRLGKPEDVASLVTFLATAEPSFLTGQTYVVDGFQFHV